MNSFHETAVAKKSENRYSSPTYGFANADLFRNYLFDNSFESNEPGYGLKDMYAYDTLNMEKSVESALAMQDAQVGAMGDVMGMAFGFQQMGDSNARAEIFDYTMRGLDKQTELQNYFANQQYGRDLGALAATGEETRKNYAAQGVENRLSRITEGEQDRLSRAAQGDQDRKLRRVEGRQERLNIAARGDEERKTYDANDLIDARTEERARARSKALARSF